MAILTDAQYRQFQQVTTLGEAVAARMITPARVIHVMGQNPVITGANTEDVWTSGGLYAFPPDAGCQLEILSDSTDDDVGGTGATAVRVDYLDTSYVERSETIVLDGTTPSPSTATNIMRINGCRVVTAGTGKKNAGTITIREEDNSPIYNTIAPGHNRAMNMAYTVPAGKQLMIFAMAFSSSGDAAKAYLRYNLCGNFDNAIGVRTTIEYPLLEVSVANAGVVYSMPVPAVLPEKVDTHMTVTGDAATLTAIASCSWRGILG